MWGTFLLTKWCRFWISKPFSNRSEFEIFCTSHSLAYFLTSIFLVTLRIQNFLTIQFCSLSDPVSENRVRFERSIKKDHLFFFDLPKFFSFSTWGAKFLNFSKKLNFSMTMRSWTLVMVPLFSVSDPLSVKLTVFKIWPNLKLSIF